MPSFDLVSKTDLMEMKNAIQMAQREIGARYDFKGSNTEVELTDEAILINAPDEYKIKAALEIIRNQMVKRNIGQRCIDPGKVAPHGQRGQKLTVAIKNGIDKEKARIINRVIKESGIKVQSSILDDKVRVTAKKIDDLQAVFALLRSHKEVDIELQMENMKRD